MTSADTIKGWNLLLWLTSRMLWSELNLVPRYRGVLEGIPACLDGPSRLAPPSVRPFVTKRCIVSWTCRWLIGRGEDGSDSRMDGIP